jgi:hypothetical protein
MGIALGDHRIERGWGSTKKTILTIPTSGMVILRPTYAMAACPKSNLEKLYHNFKRNRYLFFSDEGIDF